MLNHRILHLVRFPPILLFAGLIVVVNAFYLWGHELDDALIYARFLQNLLEGKGYVYNPGEYVNGLTSPLFGYLSILPSWMLGDARDGVMLVSVLATLTSLIAFYAVLRLLIPSISLAAFSAVLSAMASITYLNLGMEASLFTTWVAVSFYCYLRDKPHLLGFAIAFSILSRPEGVFLVPAMAIDTLISQRRWPPMSCYWLPGGLIIAQSLFNVFYYDALLPSSGLAKLSQGESGFWGDNNFLLTLVGLFRFGITHAGSWSVMAVLIVVSLFSLKVTSAHSYLRVSFLFLVMYSAFFALLNLPAQAWYYAIYYSIFWTYVALGLYWLADRYLTGRNRIKRIAFTVFVISGLSLQEPRLLAELGKPAREDYKEIGLWLAENTEQDASIAVVEIGTIGWYSQRRIIDILGLVTDEVADYVAEGDFVSWLLLYPPDFMMVHDPVWQFESVLEQSSSVLGGSFNEVPNFHFPGFRLYAFNPQG